MFKMCKIRLMCLLLLNIVQILRVVSISLNIKNPFNILSAFKLSGKKVDDYLIGFHVENCEYCEEMSELLDQLEREEGIKVNILDANEQYNIKLLRRLDKGRCGGLPFYYNVRTNRYICGATSYENLLVWATDGINKTHMPPRSNEIKEHKKYRSLGLIVRLIRWLNESLDNDNNK